MTRTKKAKTVEVKDETPPPRAKRRASVRWVNPVLDVHDTQWLEDNTVHALEDLIEAFEGLQAGQRLSCNYDERTDRWLAILYDNDVDTQEPVPALSVRGAAPIDALLVLGYFVIRKYPNGWQSETGAPRSRFG